MSPRSARLVAQTARAPRAALALAWLGVGCAQPATVLDGDADDDERVFVTGTCPGDSADAIAAPRADLVPALGAATTLDVATWNLHNFPSNERSIERVVDVIASLDVDIVALQEIADEAAFAALVQRLPAHGGVLSRHVYADGSYQKLAFLYRCSVVTPTREALLFDDDDDAFPRPALRVGFHYDDGTRTIDLTAIDVHLKAGGDEDDFRRRRDALARLEPYVRAGVDGPGSDAYVVLGDFNESVTTPRGRSNMSPFLDDARYAVLTEAAATDGAESYIGGGDVIDHVVVSRAFVDAATAVVTSIPRVDTSVERFRDDASDHRPVVVSIALR